MGRYREELCMGDCLRVTCVAEATFTGFGSNSTNEIDWAGS